MQASPDNPRASSRRIVLLCGLAAATLTVAFAVYRPAFLAQMDDRAYDTLARSASVAPADARIAIVDVDERSLSAIGQWPWRRDLIAQLITRVRELGASVVALDVIFAEPDRYETSGRPGAESAADTAFASALAGGRVLLGYAFTFDPSQAAGTDCVLHPISLPILHPGGTTIDSPVFHASGAICSLPPLARAAGASGFLNAVPDADGTLRRVPVLIEYQGRIYPSLSLAAMMASTGARAIALRSANVNTSALILDRTEVPLDGRGNLLLRYRGGPRSFRHVSAADVLQGRTPAATFANAHGLRRRHRARYARDRRDTTRQAVHRRRGAGDGRRQPAAAGLRLASRGRAGPRDTARPHRRNCRHAPRVALRPRPRHRLGIHRPDRIVGRVAPAAVDEGRVSCLPSSRRLASSRPSRARQSPS